MSLKIRLLDDLNRAACVHVTCEEEMNHCRNLGVTSPIAIVPNPVEIKEYPKAAKAVRDAGLRLDLEAPSDKYPSMTGALQHYLLMNEE